MDNHYADLKIEPIKYMESNFSPAEYIGFLKGNIIKYTSRYGHKEGNSTLEESRKIYTYSKFLYEFEKARSADK